MDFLARYRACQSRDARFDGQFIVGLRTTGIYCRSICLVPMPRPKNVEFFPCAAAAAAAGLRPCKRCRPEAAPGSSAWIGSPPEVTRALRLIEAGFLDRGTVEDLARTVHLGARQLRRLLRHHVGASPTAIAAERRLSLARLLVAQSGLPLTRVAFEAGFSSVRQFNAAYRDAFDGSPSASRHGRPQSPNGHIALTLPFRPPFDWDGLLAFFARRAIPGVEEVADGRYRRTIATDAGGGTILVGPAPGRSELEVHLPCEITNGLAQAVIRVRRMFDLDADSWYIAETLEEDSLTRTALKHAPGIRLPGCWDGFELAVRAILGQQVSVAAARSLAARLVREHGRRFDSVNPILTMLFPDPGLLLDAPLPWLPPRRAEAIRSLARAVAEGSLTLSADADAAETTRFLRGLPGIGPWTGEYIAMRALADPDAFPAQDIVLRRVASRGRPLTPGQLEARAEAWRPWRAYAVVALWAMPPPSLPAGWTVEVRDQHPRTRA